MALNAGRGYGCEEQRMLCGELCILRPKLLHCSSLTQVTRKVVQMFSSGCQSSGTWANKAESTCKVVLILFPQQLHPNQPLHLHSSPPESICFLDISLGSIVFHKDRNGFDDRSISVKKCSPNFPNHRLI